MKKQKEAPVSPIAGHQLKEFNLTFDEASDIDFNCRVLKDFAHINLLACRKLHENTKVLKPVLDRLSDDGKNLNDRRISLNEALSKGATVELLKSHADLEKEIISHNRRVHTFYLYTVPFEAFPFEEADREKYGIKIINDGFGKPIEVDRVTCWLELQGTIIEPQII